MYSSVLASCSTHVRRNSNVVSKRHTGRPRHNPVLSTNLNIHVRIHRHQKTLVLLSPLQLDNYRLARQISKERLGVLDGLQSQQT